jgi:hypothetical protein
VTSQIAAVANFFPLVALVMFQVALFISLMMCGFAPILIMSMTRLRVCRHTGGKKQYSSQNTDA